MDNVNTRQGTSSGTVTTTGNNLHPPTPKISLSKIDATDRRHIEAQNEDKSHSTKETLDDIKWVHQKEMKKKEQNNIEVYGSENTVSVTFILNLNIVFSFYHSLCCIDIFYFRLVVPAQEMQIRMPGIRTMP